jgi:hypothetical protein
MENKDFDEFVRRQQGAASVADAEINWEKQRDEWLEYLNLLYKRVEAFLTTYTSSGQIVLEYRNVKLNEENIGSYTARKMVLRIGRQEVSLVPVGTLLIGCKGRVDIVGPAGKARVLLVDSEAPGLAALVHVSVGTGGKVPVFAEPASRTIKWAWRIVTRPPERRFVEITQERLFDLIMEVANG